MKKTFLFIIILLLLGTKLYAQPAAKVRYTFGDGSTCPSMTINDVIWSVSRDDKGLVANSEGTGDVNLANVVLVPGLLQINMRQLAQAAQFQAGEKVTITLTIKPTAACQAGATATVTGTYQGGAITAGGDPTFFPMELGVEVTPPAIAVAGMICAGGTSTNISITNLTEFSGWSIKVYNGAGNDVSGNFTIGAVGATTTIAANAGTASGNYKVKLEKGSESSNEAELIVGTVPTLTITPSNADGGDGYYCVSGSDRPSVNLTANGASGTFTWTKPDGSTLVQNSLANITTAGQYKVKVTKDGVCPAEASIQVKELTAPTAPAIVPPANVHVCKNDGGTTNLSITPNNPAYTYHWSGTQTELSSIVSHNSLTTNAAGNSITVKADDGKCRSVASTSLIMYAHTLTVGLDITGTQQVTSGAQKVLNATATPVPDGATINNWTWTTTGAGIASGDNSSSIQTNSITSTSTYKVTAEDEYGCKATSPVTTFTVKAGSVWNISLADVAKCTGETITLSPSITGATPAAPVIWTWESSDGLAFSSTSVQSPTVTTTTPGIYHAKLTVEDGEHVKKSKEVVVKIYGKPSLNNVEVISTSVCKGDEVKVRANGAVPSTTPLDQSTTLSYEWEGANPTADPSIATNTLNPGLNTFKVKVRDGNQCVSELRTVDFNAHDIAVVAKINNSSSTTTVAYGSTANLDCQVSFNPNASGTVDTYEWTSNPANLVDGNNQGQTASTVALTNAGSFIVKVRDTDGCEATDDIAYTLSGGQLTVTASDKTLCAGTMPNLTCTPSGGNGGAIDSYEWVMLDGLTVDDPGVASPKITTTTPGVYHAKVKIRQGTLTAESLEITVTINAVPQLIAFPTNPQTARVGTTVNLTASASPATATLTWAGSPVTGSQIGTQGTASIVAGTFANAGAAHSYTVTAAIGDCRVDSTLIINVIDRIQDIVITADDVTACEGENQIISADATGGAGGTLSYRWEVIRGDIQLTTTTGKTTSIASASPGSHTIRVTVTDNTDSPDKADPQYKDITVIVNRKPIINSIDVVNRTTGNSGTTVNFGDELQLTANVNPSDATCRWTETGSTLLATTGNSVYTSALANNNTYTVEASSNGCTDSKEVTVIVNRPETEALLELELARKCADSGESMILSMKASGGLTYSFTLKNNSGQSWDYDGAGPWTKTIALGGQDTYFVQNFRAFKNGVEITPTQVVPNEIEALFYTTPSITIAGGNVQPVCEGNALTLHASSQLSGVEYTWDNGVINGQSFFPQSSGVYTVTAVSDKNCRATSTVNVTIVPKPTITIGASDENICLGETVTLTAGGAAEYTWNNGQTGTSIEVTPNVGGSVKYVVTGKENVNGCTDTAVVNIVVNEPPVILSTTKPERTIAIDKNATFGVKVSGKDLHYSWQRWDGNDWIALYDDQTDLPTISGANTDTLVLGTVPRSWNGTKLRCYIRNDCGDVDTTFLLNVKECFEILDIEWNMCEGIRPETDPTIEVDGWYCPGTKIAVCANLILEDTDIEIENAVYKWTVDGLSTDDGRWGEMTFISDSSILSWIPPVSWQDNITVALCAYVDGACDTVCKKYLRLKAQEFTDLDWKLQTSVDPARMFCPGDTITFTIADTNQTAGLHPAYKWYNDIFDLQLESSQYNETISLENEKLVMKMGQKDSWIKVVLTPSPEICTRQAEYVDTAFLRVKDFVNPKFSIWCEDTLACLNDEIYLEARWENAGEHPSFQWTRSIGYPYWDLGTDSHTTTILDDKDMWIKCVLKPSEEVCFRTDTIYADAIQIRTIMDPEVRIFADLEGKTEGDEIIVESDITKMPVQNPTYIWYINNMIYPENESELISSDFHQGDKVQLGVHGERICQNQILSNILEINFGSSSRDTLFVIYKGEAVRHANMFKPGDELCEFFITTDGYTGNAKVSMGIDGIFNYIPDRDFTGKEKITYKIVNKYTGRTEIGYIYVDVRGKEKFFIPNIITPNNDGLNDMWKLDFLEDYPDHMITVYNRNGKIVFRADHYQNDWDGTGKGDSGYVAYFNLANGVYTYVIDLGNKEILKGWLEIRRDMNRGKYSR